MPVHLLPRPPAELGMSCIPSYSSWPAESETTPAQQFVNLNCKYFTVTGKCPREATFCKYTHDLTARAKFLAAHKKPDALDKLQVRKHQLARTFLDEDCAEFTKRGRCSREKDFCPFTHNQMARDEFVGLQKKQAKAKKLSATSPSVAAPMDLAGGKTFGPDTYVETKGELATAGKKGKRKVRGKPDDSREKFQQDSPNAQTIAKERQAPSKSTTTSNASKQKAQKDLSAVELATDLGKIAIKGSANLNVTSKQNHAQSQNKSKTTTERKSAGATEASKATSKQKPYGRGLSRTPCRTYSETGFCRFKNKCGFLHVDKETQLNATSSGEISQAVVPVATIKTASTSLSSNERLKRTPQLSRAIVSRNNALTKVRDVSFNNTSAAKPDYEKQLPKPSERTTASKINLTTHSKLAIAAAPGHIKPTYSAIAKNFSPSELFPTTSPATVPSSQNSPGPSPTSNLPLLTVEPRKAVFNAGIDLRVEVTDLGFGRWGDEAVALWAKHNLRPEVREKLVKKYKPYIDQGVLPLSATMGNRRKTDSKSEFHHFVHFPGEIKAMIWEFALRNSSYESQVYVACRTLQDGTFCRSIRPLLRSPSLIRTCSQSREIAKKFYELSFSTNSADVGCGMVYFNFKTDRLMLRASDPRQLIELAETLQKEDRKRLKYLSIPLSYWINGNKKEFIRIITRFTSLRVLYMVVSDSLVDEVYARDLQILETIDVNLQEASKQRYNGKALEINVVKQTIDALKARRWGLEDIKHGEHPSEEPMWEGAFPGHKPGTLSRWC